MTKSRVKRKENASYVCPSIAYRIRIRTAIQRLGDRTKESGYETTAERRMPDGRKGRVEDDER